MQVQEFKIAGLKLITMKKFADERGFFSERFKEFELPALGIHDHFIQDNHSRSQAQVLRGLHFQYEKPQAKLVTCLTGQILDVAVDIRSQSPTYGQHVACILDSENPQWFYIPAGFAHGFCVLGDRPADVMYKVNAPWNSPGEGAIRWNDPDLAIEWPLQSPLLSAKDAQAPSFRDYKLNSRF